MVTITENQLLHMEPNLVDIFYRVLDLVAIKNIVLKVPIGDRIGAKYCVNQHIHTLREKYANFIDLRFIDIIELRYSETLRFTGKQVYHVHILF